MRFLVTMVSIGAALTFVAASGLMNLVFMSSLGRSDLERQILGAVSVAVSVFIAFLPTLLVWAWRERRYLYIALGVPVFLAFAAFSLSSAVGFAAKNRGSLSDDRALANTRLAGVKHEIADAEEKLKAFGATKPVAALEAELRRLEQDWRWQSTRACQDATVDASRAFCKSYFDRQGEAATATEAANLETRLVALRSDARRLEEQGAGRVTDNQTSVLADVLGLSAAKVERDLMLFLAVLVEVGAALGLYFATGHIRSPAELSPVTPSGRGLTVIEGVPLTVVQTEKPPVNAKQITTASPRRVPRLSRG
jgi:hypothetical protein